MAASAFVQLLSSAVPLPGGTGGAEGGFALFLGHFYGSAATAGYLLWRLITFIAPTILAAPLLGLHSAHNESLHDRWDRLMVRFGRTRHGAGQKRVRTGARAGASAASPARMVSDAASAAASKASAASDAAPRAVSASASARPERRVVEVRRTSGGITVRPRCVREQKKKNESVVANSAQLNYDASIAFKLSDIYVVLL